MGVVGENGEVAELVAEARTAYLPWPYELCVRVVDALEAATKDAPEDAEWEYGNRSLSGEIVAATSQRWAQKHFASAGVPIYRRRISPGEWSPVPVVVGETKDAELRYLRATGSTPPPHEEPCTPGCAARFCGCDCHVSASSSLVGE